MNKGNIKQTAKEMKCSRNTIYLNSDMTPCEKLKSLGYATAQEFYLFPTLILDRLVALPETKNAPVSVQEHLDYDLFGQKLYCSTRTHFGQIIKLLDTGLSTI